jgi:hypothetical protein
MEDITNNSFEEQWQRAFDDASSPPSEAVWERIELSLENNFQPKLSNNSYTISAISAIILGISLWLFMSPKEEKKLLKVIENKVVIPNNSVEKMVSKIEEKLVIKQKENRQVKKAFILEKPENIESITKLDLKIKESENQERIITNSIDFMSPIMATKKINSELANPSINIPLENTPYYEMPKPKSKKKSIWDKIRISAGVGVYQ